MEKYTTMNTQFYIVYNIKIFVEIWQPWRDMQSRTSFAHVGFYTDGFSIKRE